MTDEYKSFMKCFKKKFTITNPLFPIESHLQSNEFMFEYSFVLYSSKYEHDMK